MLPTENSVLVYDCQRFVYRALRASSKAVAACSPVGSSRGAGFCTLHASTMAGILNSPKQSWSASTQQPSRYICLVQQLLVIISMNKGADRETMSTIKFSSIAWRKYKCTLDTSASCSVIAELELSINMDNMQQEKYMLRFRVPMAPQQVVGKQCHSGNCGRRTVPLVVELVHKAVVWFEC